MTFRKKLAEFNFWLQLDLPLTRSSLLLAARHQLSAGQSRGRRLLGGTVRLCFRAWKSSIGFFVLLLFAGLMGLLVPPKSWGFDALSNVTEAGDFLSTLWQVEAAALALSLAVVLFLFQAVATSHGGDLREFAEDSHLLKFLDVGVIALLLVGLSLLGIGSPEEGPWAATWATSWAGATVLTLSLLFRSALHAVSETTLHQRRLARLSDRTRDFVNDDLLSRVAYGLLEGFCKEEDIDFEPIFSNPGSDSLRLTSAFSGSVSDINLSSLLRATAAAKRAGNTLSLSSHLGGSVGPGSLLAYGSPLLDIDPQIFVARTFRISPRESEGLTEALEQVHAEALRAIRNGDPTSYERTAATYLKVTESFAEAWAAHPDLPDPRTGLGIIEDPIRRLMRSVYEELHLVLRYDSREIMFEATSLPTTISSIGVKTGVLDLSREGLRLAIELYRLASAAPASEVARLALERSSTLLLEHAEYRIAFPIGRDDMPVEQRLALLPFAHLSFGFIADLMRMMINNSDTATLTAVDSRWSDLLEHWTPEYAHPDDWDVQRLREEHGEDDSRVEAAARQAEDNKRLAREKKALFDSRSRLRFGLAFWTIHRLLQASDKQPLAGMFRHFISHFPSLNEIVSITDSILDAEWRGGFGQIWSNWLLEDLPAGRAHMIPTDSRLMQTFLVGSLMKTSPDADPPGIQPFDWIRLRLQDLLGLLDALVADTAVWEAFPEVTDLAKRKENLAQALTTAAEAQQRLEDEEVRSSSADPGKVSELEQAIRKGVSEHQWVPSLFARVERLNPPASQGPADEKWFGTKQWIPKEMLLSESRFVGNEMFAEDIGRVIADGEAESLAKAFSDSPQLDIGPENARERLESAIEALQAEGLKPSLIFIPLDWRLDNELGLVSPFGTADVPDWVPPAARNAFQGTVEGAAVFSWHSVPKDQIQIADLARYGIWTQWLTDAGGDTVKIEITDHSEEEAVELTTKHDKLFARGNAQTPEERAAELRKHLFLAVHERFSLEIVNPAAARWIRVTPSEDE